LKPQKSRNACILQEASEPEPEYINYRAFHMGIPIFLDSYGCQNLEGHIFPQPTDSEGPVISAQFKSVFSSTHND
jgi:hypothetical protein